VIYSRAFKLLAVSLANFSKIGASDVIQDGLEAKPSSGRRPLPLLGRASTRNTVATLARNLAVAFASLGYLKGNHLFR
jgi:hypothetical protein